MTRLQNYMSKLTSVGLLVYVGFRSGILFMLILHREKVSPSSQFFYILAVEAQSACVHRTLLIVQSLTLAIWQTTSMSKFSLKVLLIVTALICFDVAWLGATLTSSSGMTQRPEKPRDACFTSCSIDVERYSQNSNIAFISHPLKRLGLT